MTEDEKIQVAVFRFSVIGDFVNGTQMTRAEKRQLLREKCARKWPIPLIGKRVELLYHGSKPENVNDFYNDFKIQFKKPTLVNSKIG